MPIEVKVDNQIKTTMDQININNLKMIKLKIQMYTLLNLLIMFLFPFLIILIFKYVL